ncbi:MAG: hypothetical protein AAF438_20210 [Pseudomonadota bacterium]
MHTFADIDGKQQAISDLTDQLACLLDETDFEQEVEYLQEVTDEVFSVSLEANAHVQGRANEAPSEIEVVREPNTVAEQSIAPSIKSVSKRAASSASSVLSKCDNDNNSMIDNQDKVRRYLSGNIVKKVDWIAKYVETRSTTGSGDVHRSSLKVKPPCFDGNLLKTRGVRCFIH